MPKKRKVKGDRTALELLYQEQEINYQGVTIVVRPLPARRAVRIIDSVAELGQATAGGATIIETVGNLYTHVLRVLDECMDIPSAPDLVVEDLPFDALPEILAVCLSQSFNLGKWKALGQQLGLVGVGGDLIRGLLSGTTSGEPVQS